MAHCENIKKANKHESKIIKIQSDLFVAEMALSKVLNQIGGTQWTHNLQVILQKYQ